MPDLSNLDPRTVNLLAVVVWVAFSILGVFALEEMSKWRKR